MIPFKAVATQLTVAFQLFKPNGSPLRADVKLQLKQADKASTASSNSGNKPQNPTTRSAGGLGVHLVRDGDSLPSIAHATYGDPNRWRLIAEANGIDDPLRLRRGAALNLPRLDV
jgi:nucleoid-associated protein YgaU